jgi:hypothetical protein
MVSIKKYILPVICLSLGIFAAQAVVAQTIVNLAPVNRFELLAKSAARQFDLQAQERRDRLMINNAEKFTAIKKVIDQMQSPAKRSLAVEIINENQQVNLAWTNYFADVLNQLDLVLAKIKNQAEMLREKGTDVTKLDTAIANADRAINVARINLGEQISKSYMPNASKVNPATVTSDLRVQFKLLRDSLLSDFISMRDGSIKDARQAVILALQALASIPNSY